MLSIIKNATKNRSSLTLKTLITIPTISEISSYTFALTTNLIYTLIKKGFKAIPKAFRVLYLRGPLPPNKSFQLSKELFNCI